MTQNFAIGSLITQELEQQGPCTLETLAYKLSTCSWNQVFMAIDTLSREGAITLQPHARFQYLVSLAHAHPPVMQQFDPAGR